MALSGTLEWDIRTTGSNSNGGAFRRGATGVDYSQQDSPQVTYTDLVIGGTNTQLTSAAFPFTSAHVGNVINVTSGTGFTTGRYEVMSVAGSTATMDRAVGTAASTGGNGRLGGSMLTLGGIIPNPAVNFNTIWIKSGTYSITTAVSTSAAGGFSFRIIGYQTTHGDNGTKPVLTTATNSVTYVLVQGSSTRVFMRNVKFTNTAASPWASITVNSAAEFEAYDCEVDGGAQGFFSSATARPITMVRCTLTNCSDAGLVVLNNAHAINCRIIACGNAVRTTAGGAPVNDAVCRLSRNVIANNTGNGVHAGGASRLILESNTIANNGGAGIATTGGSLFMLNNVVYGNTTYGLDAVNLFDQAQTHNAFGDNTSGNRSTGTPAGDGDVALAANPFTDDSTGDYSLNDTVGGGAACKGAGTQPE